MIFTLIVAKAANRLSSDTDNETDRLLGSQRNDQLQKIANNDSNGGSLDHQSTNNYNKPASNSREGECPLIIPLVTCVIP